MLDNTSSNNLRATRIDDELKSDAPTPLRANIAFPPAIEQNPFSKIVTTQNPLRLSITRLRPDDDRYLIGGGFFEFTPITYRGDIFSKVIVELPGVAVPAVQCKIKWEVKSLDWKIDDGFGGEIKGTLFYRTGIYTIVSAELMIFLDGNVPFDQSGFPTSSNRDHVAATSIQYINLFHLVPSHPRRLIYPADLFTIQ